MVPEISIIIPTYNRATLLKRAIESVQAQTYTNWELLVVDDGSIDETARLVETYHAADPRIQYIGLVHSGKPTTPRNTGIKKSRGRYIAFLDSDDFWHDHEKLAIQKEFLDTHTHCAVVGTGIRYVSAQGDELGRFMLPETDLNIRNKLLRINCFAMSSVVCRKKLLLKGTLPTASSVLEDYELWLEIGKYGTFFNLPRYSVSYLTSQTGYGTFQMMRRLWQNIVLSQRYKTVYPHYFQALALGVSKILIYPIFYILPISIRVWMLKIHKQL